MFQSIPEIVKEYVESKGCKIEENLMGKKIIKAKINPPVTPRTNMQAKKRENKLKEKKVINPFQQVNKTSSISEKFETETVTDNSMNTSPKQIEPKQR